MRSYYLIMFLAVLLMQVACDKDPLSPDAFIEKKINSEKPIKNINIGLGTGVVIFYYRKDMDISGGMLYENAYAENGFLIIITEDDIFYYSLSTAKSITTGKNRVDITY